MIKDKCSPKNWMRNDMKNITTANPKNTLEEAAIDYELPEEFDTFRPKEKTELLREYVLRCLTATGPHTASEIATLIGAPYVDPVRRALNYLSSTKAIYAEQYGRELTYFPNGRLGHTSLQKDYESGNKIYRLRTYVDKRMGRYVTLTELTRGMSMEPRAEGGIKIDLVDIEPVAELLLDVYKKSKDSDRIDRNLSWK